MSNNKDIMEISDHRNNEQRHQLHRHTARSKKRKNQTTSHHSSRPPKDSRSAARSWKRQELNMIQDYSDVRDTMDDEPLDFWGTDRTSYYNRTTSDSKPSKMFLMGSAVNGTDAAFLTFLKIMLKEKYGQRRHRTQSLPSVKIKERRLHTMLTYVIDQKDSEGIRIVLDNIFAGYIYKTMIEHVCSNGRTALWYACRNGDLGLVQELIMRGHANFNKCGVLIVAAQNGHEKVVDYLLKRGCDANRRVRNYNESALHAASRRNHLGIVNLLLKHGANPSLLDQQKRTALDYAIHKRHIEVAKVLIFHQHGGFKMSHTGFTPLMLAAYCKNTPIIDILWNLLPLQQVLDELSLLACKYIIGGNANKRDQAYCYFEMALSRRTPLYDSISCAAYEFLSECHTLDELALIRENDNKIRMYALLVSERLLLKSDQINHHLSLIMKQSNIYKWNGSSHSEMRLTTYNTRGAIRGNLRNRRGITSVNSRRIWRGHYTPHTPSINTSHMPSPQSVHHCFHRCLQLRIYAYQLFIQTKHDHSNNVESHKDYIFKLFTILREIFRTENSVPIESLALVWTWLLKRIDRKILLKLLYIITYLIESGRTNSKEQYILLGLIRQAVSKNITMEGGHPLFTHFIQEVTNDLKTHKFASTSVSPLSIVKLLVRSGANINEVVPNTKQTPLHIIAKCQNVDVARSVITLLLDANAHIDCIDTDDCQPEDVAYHVEIKEFLIANRKHLLKCRCAHLIISKNLSYEHYLSSNLINFIRMHSSDGSSVN